MPLIAGLVRGQGRARVEVKRHIELLDSCPKVPILGHVAIANRIRLSSLCESIDQGATEAQVFDTARQFLGSTLRVLQCQCGESLQTFGIFAMFSAK
jgi:hypothetical protein